MLTCDPNVLVAPLHPEAMITILEPAYVKAWLLRSCDDVVARQPS